MSDEERAVLEHQDRKKEQEAQLKAVAIVAKALAEGTMIESSIARLQHAAKIKTRLLIQTLDDPEMREPLHIRVERISKGVQKARHLP